MRNFFSKNKEEQPQIISPYHVFIAPTFKIDGLQIALEEIIVKSTKKEYCIANEETQIRVDIDIVTVPKKDEKKYTSYIIKITPNQLSITAQKVEVVISTAEKRSKAIDLSNHKDTIVQGIVRYANQGLDNGFLKGARDSKVELMASLSLLEENFLLAQRIENEIYLTCLGITNLKSALFEVAKKKNDYCIVTSQRNLILQTDGLEFRLHDISNHVLELKEKIGKDTIVSKKFSFDTELFNDSLFVSIEKLWRQIPEKRVEWYADLLFEKYNSKSSQFPYIQQLYAFQVTEADQLKRALKSQLIPQFAKKQCGKTLLVSSDFKQSLYNDVAFGNTLLSIMTDWSIAPKEQYKLLELLTANTDNFKLKNIAVFYDAAIAGMVNVQKAPEDELTYRIPHLEYLNETKQYEKAIPYYEYVLTYLEDDSILELISDTSTNVLNGEDCNPLRIQLLETLAEIKETLQQPRAPELIALAKLQPLVLDRLTQLVTAGVLTEKANTMLSLFMPNAFNNATTITPIHNSTTTYSKAALFDLVVPGCFKETKGFLDAFTNLIAQVNPPDYKQVTTYSEKLSISNFPEAFTILQKVAAQLQMETPECYIGNGDFSNGIIGVEGSPNFIILGKDHLQKGNPDYLTENELVFNLTQELSHILFEHTRLTSKDVWRGAKKKGMDVAGVLLVALPMVSTVGSFAGKFINISKYTKVFNSVDAVANVVDKGQTALTYGEKITDKFTKQQKESELLATSRLMEISADRVGLLLTRDLQSCVHVLLKNNTDFKVASAIINQKGLYAYLSQQNEEGAFIHQELIIRIKTLFSFYLRLEAN